jgi:hypothetical protein
VPGPAPALSKTKSYYFFAGFSRKPFGELTNNGWTPSLTTPVKEVGTSPQDEALTPMANLKMLIRLELFIFLFLVTLSTDEKVAYWFSFLSKVRERAY